MNPYISLYELPNHANALLLRAGVLTSVAALVPPLTAVLDSSSDPVSGQNEEAHEVARQRVFGRRCTHRGQG